MKRSVRRTCASGSTLTDASKFNVRRMTCPGITGMPLLAAASPRLIFPPGATTCRCSDCHSIALFCPGLISNNSERAGEPVRVKASIRCAAISKPAVCAAEM
ncbi:MAG: hypothetical protein EBS64_11385, partial [Verrucomicrobia bacterium]|nr:hypothetical protein [Verrucomicrobiota bacterium]